MYGYITKEPIGIYWWIWICFCQKAKVEFTIQELFRDIENGTKRNVNYTQPDLKILQPGPIINFNQACLSVYLGIKRVAHGVKHFALIVGIPNMEKQFTRKVLMLNGN